MLIPTLRLASLLLLAPAGTETSFQGLGFGDGSVNSQAWGVSGDGNVVVGQRTVCNPCILIGWRWTEATGMIDLGVGEEICGQPGDSVANATSFDGAVVVGRKASADCGTCSCRFGFRWTDAGNANILPPDLDACTPRLFAYAVSDSGEVIAGDMAAAECRPHPFRWTAGSGAVALNLLGIGPEFSGRAYGISPDGAVIVGEVLGPSGRAMARWVDGGDPELLTSPGGDSGYAADASLDGSVIVGLSSVFAPPDLRAFRWTSSSGAVSLGVLDDENHSWAAAVSTDGRIVVGGSQGAEADGFIWDPIHGMRRLRSVLESSGGPDLSGWRLFPEDVSADGTVIVGAGINPSGQVEAWRAVLPRQDLDDTDGDGLLDFWETDGIDVDGDGTIDIDLPAMGADPMHKNLFVELDTMGGSPDIEQAALWVEEAFFFAPEDMVDNPDGIRGVDLFIMIDDQDIASESWPDNPFESDDFDLTKALFFGTDAERQHPASEQLLEIKRKIFRYCVYIAGTEGGRWVGTARGGPPNEPSNDFILAGDNISSACPDCSEERFQQYVAATLMHELGHCLGLEHGGADEVNYKPNYISVMNYLDQFPWNAHAEWRLDYSRGTMFLLNERELNEQFGFFDGGRNIGQTTFWGKNECVEKDPCFPFAIGEVERGQTSIRNGQWIDFNGDGVFEESACADLNYMGEGYREGDLPTPCQTLLDSPDWAILKYALAAEGAAPGGDPPNELTVEDVLLLNATFRAPCPADVDASGEVDFADLLEVLARWNEETGHPADVDGDGIVGFGDVLYLLGAWGECP